MKTKRSQYVKKDDDLDEVKENNNNKGKTEPEIINEPSKEEAIPKKMEDDTVRGSISIK